MGSWGYGPFDNDDAAELMLRIVEPLATEVASLHRYKYNEVRAAACALLALDQAGVYVDIETLDQAAENLQDILESDWIAEWRQPATIRKRLREEIAALRSLVKKREGALNRLRKKRRKRR
jgi:hypothetical protein